LSRLGLKTFLPQGAFYIFPDIRSTGMNSEEFAVRLLNEHGVACVPGTAFGKCGEGFVRMSYATGMEKIAQAAERITAMLKQA
jgi:aminotransferase